MPEDKTETQGQIRKLQTLIEKGLFSQVFDDLPYPAAVFTPRHTLAAVNRAFAAETNMLGDQEKGAVRMLQCKIEDMRLASAVARVFKGDAFVLEDIKDPFAMFEGIARQGAPQPGRFSRAAVFPVPAENGAITRGVIVFMP